MSAFFVSGGGGAPASWIFFDSSREATTSLWGAVRARGTRRSGSCFGSRGLPSLSSEAAMTVRDGGSTSVGRMVGNLALMKMRPTGMRCRANASAKPTAISSGS